MDAIPSFTVAEARYAKGKVVVRPMDGRGGMKGRSAYLAESLGGRWANRSGGYVMSPAGAAKLERLHAAGFDAHMRLFSDSPARFFHRDRSLDDLTASQALKLAA